MDTSLFLGTIWNLFLRFKGLMTLTWWWQDILTSNYLEKKKGFFILIPEVQLEHLIRLGGKFFEVLTWSENQPSFALLKLFSNGSGFCYLYKYDETSEKGIILEKKEIKKRSAE